MFRPLHAFFPPAPLILSFCLLAAASVEAKDLIKNQNFSGSRKPWVISWHDGDVKDMDIDVEKGELRIRVPQPTPIPYVRLMQPVKIKEGETYTLSYESRGDADNLSSTPMLVMVCQRRSPWESYGVKEKVYLEKDWKKFEHTFTATYIDKSNEPVLRFNFGNFSENVYFRAVSLIHVSD